MMDDMEKRNEVFAATLEDLKEELKNTYLYNFPKKKEFLCGKYMLYGSPGVGKTQAVRQVAQELAEILGLKFVDFSETSFEEREKILQDKAGKYFIFVDLTGPHLQPEDLCVPDVGGRISRGESYHFLAPSWVEALRKYPGILFIDEITNITRKDVQTMLFKIIDERTVGGVKLHDKVMIVSAGNPTRESSAAKELPEPLLNRLMIIDVKGPTGKQWMEYAASCFPEIPRDILAFLSYYVDEYTQNGLDIEELERKDEKSRTFTSPRSLFLLLARLRQNVQYLNDRRKLPEVLRSLNKITVIDKAHQLEFTNYLERRHDLLNLLKKDNDNIKITTRLAAASLLGEIVRGYVMGNKQELFIPIREVPAYLRKACETRRDLLNLFMFGLGAFERNTVFSDSVKLVVFANEILNGTEPDKALKKASNEAREFTIARVIETEGEIDYDRLFPVTDKDEFVARVNELIKDYMETKIVNILDLLQAYLSSSFSGDKYTQSRYEKELRKVLHEKDIEEIIGILNQKAKQNLSRYCRNLRQ